MSYFRVRGIYNVKVEGFDIRNFAETTLPVTIFRMPCTDPVVYLPVNQTDFEKKFDMPTYYKSVPFQVEAKVLIKCNETLPTW